jgi:anthranilate phosphoribosyltransferase
MKELLELVLSGDLLSVGEARELMLSMLAEPIDPLRTAEILTALRHRGVAVNELDGFSQALMTLAIPLEIGAADAIDVCGTGGDGRGTFNISTCAAFVLAAAGHKVVKHGNKAVSSSCGSSDVLEALGVSPERNPEALRQALHERNICFLHAPLFHPALQAVAPIRRELKVRTVFNMLGPLINPANPGVQVNGVYDREVLRLYGELLSRRGKRFAALCSQDGYDEVTLTSPVDLVTAQGGRELSVDDFGCRRVEPGELQGGTSVNEAAEIVRAVLRGKGTDVQQEVVAANAGLAMWIKDATGTLRGHVSTAKEIISSGAAYEVLEKSVGQV